MDQQKIRRFLEGVNQGLEVSRRRLEAEREYLGRLEVHVGPLRLALQRLHGDPGSFAKRNS
ncbi:MAG: hypothetical protein RBU45_09295 [Myxococcota bacterium]|nr:hypothetical protein [Myxococcota bacterium]